MALSYLGDILHVIAQGLLVPDIALLLLFMAYALFCIGSILAEAVGEHRHFKVVMPKFLSSLMNAAEDEIPEVIAHSGLLKHQKKSLMTVYECRDLPGDALIALAKREVAEHESRLDRITSRNNMAARVAPMLGLMGTLIPLGPGIEALGRADTAALSSSLLVAFDTTVAGLVVAAICLVIGKIRDNWYNDYLSALDAAMATMIEKVNGMHEQPPREPQTASTANRAFDHFEQPDSYPASGIPGKSASATGSVAGRATDVQVKLQPVIEPQVPLGFSLEPSKDPLASNQAATR